MNLASSLVYIMDSETFYLLILLHCGQNINIENHH